MATYVIGDVQGCYKPLRALLKSLNYQKTQDQLWFCGDLVNRGPQSLEVLQFIVDLGDRAGGVLGNHDLHLLARTRGFDQYAHTDNLEPLLAHSDCAALCEHLQQWPLVRHNPEFNYTLVHAGIAPMWTIEQAVQYSAEIESYLRDPLGSATALLSHLYGNEPRLWETTLDGWERARCIINYCTRMRFCAPDGGLELDIKGGLELHSQTQIPWFFMPNRLAEQDTILFGHWAALSGQSPVPTAQALDGGCVWGGELIALRVEDGRRFSVSPKHYT